MLKIDNSLLVDIGLDSLPEVEKNSFLKHIYETLEMRVGVRLADQMSNEQLDEFERYFEAKDDAGAFKWLETNFPNYKDIVQEEFDKLKGEVAQSAPQILSASQAAAAQPQVPNPFSQPAVPAPAPEPAQQQPDGNPYAVTQPYSSPSLGSVPQPAPAPPVSSGPPQQPASAPPQYPQQPPPPPQPYGPPPSQQQPYQQPYADPSQPSQPQYPSQQPPAGPPTQ